MFALRLGDSLESAEKDEGVYMEQMRGFVARAWSRKARKACMADLSVLVVNSEYYGRNWGDSVTAILHLG